MTKYELLSNPVSQNARDDMLLSISSASSTVSTEHEPFTLQLQNVNFRQETGFVSVYSDRR